MDLLLRIIRIASREILPGSKILARFLLAHFFADYQKVWVFRCFDTNGEVQIEGKFGSYATLLMQIVIQ